MHSFDIADTCFKMAYYVLPHYVFRDPDFVIRKLLFGQNGAAHFYLKTRSLGRALSVSERVPPLRKHAGDLDYWRTYYIVEYPSPPHLDLSHLLEEEEENTELVTQAMEGIVLSPYYSVVVRSESTRNCSYYVLGQSLVGETTLRMITPNKNLNLGPGCIPDLDALLQLLRIRSSAEDDSPSDLTFVH